MVLEWTPPLPPRPPPILHHYNQSRDWNKLNRLQTNKWLELGRVVFVSDSFVLHRTRYFRHAARSQSSKCGDSSQALFESAGLHWRVGVPAALASRTDGQRSAVTALREDTHNGHKFVHLSMRSKSLCVWNVLVFWKHYFSGYNVDVHTTLLAEAVGFLLLITSSLWIHFASPKYIIHCGVFVLIGHDDKHYAAGAVKVERNLWHAKRLRIPTTFWTHCYKFILYSWNSIIYILTYSMAQSLS